MSISQTRLSQLQPLFVKLNAQFQQPSLLDQALIHTSYANEKRGQNISHNERLEFLGDAVLDMVISEYLYKRFPSLPEGELTKARAQVVCEPTLAKHAMNLDLGDFLRLGKGEELTGGRLRVSILADALEAVIGALYLDQGFDSVSRFILSLLADELDLVASGSYFQDYKTWLQEVVQKNSDHRITYEVIAEHGPDHDKTFEIAVLVNENQMGTGFGKSKKEAEQLAAKQALAAFGALNGNGGEGRP